MKRIRIPKSKQFPKWKNTNKNKKVTPPNNIIGRNNGNIIGNPDIDTKELAMLTNICHLLANVNWLFAIDIKDIIGTANPTLQKLFEHPIGRIREHASAMLRVVDERLGEEFSEGFEQLSDEIKTLVYDYVKGNREKRQ